MFKHFVIIDPDTISCYITRKTVESVFPESQIIIFHELEEAKIYLQASEDEICLILENKNLDLSARELLSVIQALEHKNFRLIILSNAIQATLLSVIPKFTHIKFTYKPLTKARLKELVKDW